MNKTTNNNTLKILMRETDADFYVLKLGNADGIIAAGNTQKLADAICNSVAVVDGTMRIYASINQHLKTRLEAAGVDGWRVDGINNNVAVKREFLTLKKGRWQAREYIINIDECEAEPVLLKTETVCKNCGSIISKIDAVGFYCLKCLRANNKKSGFAYRYGYHEFSGDYTIFEDLDTTKEPVLGAEIERDYLGYGYNFSKDIDAATIGAVKTLYDLKKEQKRRSVFMYDGSLNNGGVEWITYPQTLKAYKKERKNYNAALEVFKKFNFNASNKAGNHIHINRDFFGDIDASRFAAAKMALILAESWAQFCAVVGRDIYNTGYTTKPAHKKNDSIFTLATKTLNAEGAHSVAVNLQHSKTIELRLFGAIKDADELILYLDIARAFAFFVKKKGLEACQVAKIADICKFLDDKQKHAPEIAERLKGAGFNEDADAVLKLTKIEEAKA